MMNYKVWRLKQRQKLCAALIFLVVYISTFHALYAFYEEKYSQQQQIASETSQQYFREEKGKSTKLESNG